MSTIELPLVLAREKLSSVCPSTGTSLNQCNWRLCNASASKAAERVVDLSAFLYRAYCTETLLPDVPISKPMRHLSNRLYTYAFGLVIEKTPGFPTRPGQSTSLTTSTAVEAMSQVAEFLEHKASNLTACGLSSETELDLAADLHFAKQYTNGVLNTEPGSRTRKRPPSKATADVATDSTYTEKAGPVSEKARGKARATEQGTCSTEGVPAEESAARQLGNRPQTSGAEQRQSKPLLRYNGPSVAQIHAQIHALQRQLAGLHRQSPLRPEVSVFNQSQAFSMPSSPLQGSPFSLTGPHESCDCGATPAMSGPATPISAMYKLAEGARIISAPERRGTAHLHASTTPLTSRPYAGQYATSDERISGRSSPPQNEMADKRTQGLDTSSGKPDLLGASSPSESISGAQTPALKTSRGRTRLEMDWDDSSSRAMEGGCSARDRLSFL